MKPSRDNFLPLRHLAAAMVIYGHAYALTRHPAGDVDLVQRFMPGFYAGSLAVFFFFAISGYLVTLSLLRQPSILRYARNRVVRIWPAYIACILFCAFVLGLAWTTLSPSAYLHDKATWHFIAGNAIPKSFVWTLPGVFSANPYPNIVNGSLWSLGVEVRWYLWLGILAALTLVRRRMAFTMVAMAWIAWCAWQWWHGAADARDVRALGCIFLGGGLCAVWRERLAITHVGMAALIVLAALVHDSRWFGPIAGIAALYFCLWVAYRLPALRWPRVIDWSYGLFLYGFPVEQCIAAWKPEIAPLAMLPLALIAAAIMAAASWQFIERPLLDRFKGKSSITDAPLPAV
ncbi:acyltransferase family protein [Solilutibacter silvestris]|uniref:Acyltransferase family protein n=1 Tax=Solilutibacter silvestris TaxID=1645665 RepID=A0A2K1PYN6_9GAMM|nr:acyltransferase [Lysobacter silvestris]PNS07905.1 Acyltransferase family protein [Lysobacter silvestris]